MWPFKRRQSDEDTKDSVPAEVQEFYQSERRERIGIAWLLAFVTLLATVVIAMGIFFGGRWAYRKIANSGKDTGNTQITTNTNQSASTKNTAVTPNTNQPAPAASSQNTTSTPSTNQSTTTGTSSAATTTQTPTRLSNTGPGDTFAIFGVVTILAALAHEAYIRRKLQNT